MLKEAANLGENSSSRNRLWVRGHKAVIGAIGISGGGFGGMGGLEGATFGVFSPAKGVHEGVFKVQNSVLS